MRVALIGSDRIGLVIAASLADVGHTVVCVTHDPVLADQLNRCELPLYEAGLEELIERCLRTGLLRFDTDVVPAAAEADLIYITSDTGFGTEAALAALDAVDGLARTLPRERLKPIVLAGFFPLGISHAASLVWRKYGEGESPICFQGVYIDPGAAVDSFRYPQRAFIGLSGLVLRERLVELLEPFSGYGHGTLFVDPWSAEIAHLSAYAMITTRFALMSVIAELCAKLGADSRLVAIGVGSDSRIGAAYLRADASPQLLASYTSIEHLTWSMHRYHVDSTLFDAVHQTNTGNIQLLLAKVLGPFEGNLSERVIGIWGLSSAPGTDDLRGAPGNMLIRELVVRGARIRAHDPEALPAARVEFADLIENGMLELVENEYACVEGAEALIVMTPWNQYLNPDLNRVRSAMALPMVFDACSMWGVERARDIGFLYHDIGRPLPAPLKSVVRAVAHDVGLLMVNESVVPTSLFAEIDVDIMAAGSSATVSVHRTYELRVGVDIDTFLREITDAPNFLQVFSEPIVFRVCVHGTAECVSVSDWTKELIYHPLVPWRQALTFELTLLETGTADITIDLYHERRWLRSLVLRLDCVENAFGGNSEMEKVWVPARAA